MLLNLEDFNFNLPKSLIALKPVYPRDTSRLMVLKSKKAIYHHSFKDLPNLLPSNCVLVFNDTKVMPARLLASRVSKETKVELLVLKKLDHITFSAKVKPLGRLKKGEVIKLSLANLEVKLIDKQNYQGIFKIITANADFDKMLLTSGQAALPPYILKNRPSDFYNLHDKTNYQTVYAKNQTSIAAPTAGLHFTKDLLLRLKKTGIELIFITLHINLGTFDKLTLDNINLGKLHEEQFNISPKSAGKINAAMQAGKKIVAVGTTTARALESSFHRGKVTSGDNKTDIFITPGFKFNVVDSLITNFHLPMSSLLIMVSSFAGLTDTKAAYAKAISSGYRFYSFGDAMLINKNHQA